MPTAPDQKATRRLGGAILLLAALAFVATAVVPRLEFARPHRYRFEVPLDRGVGMLEVDSRVLLAGLPVGRVTAADPARSGDGRFDVVSVEIAVDPEIRLGDGTAAQLVAPLLGTGTDVRLLPSGGTILESGATIPWIPPPDVLETIFGATQARSLRRIERDVERLTTWYEAHDEEISSIFAEIDADLDEIEATGRRDAEAWSATWSRIATGLDSVEAAGRAIRPPASRLAEAWNRLATGFERSEKTFGGIMPAGGGSLDELRLLAAAPDLSPIESRAVAIEAVWAQFRPRWANLVAHLGRIAEPLRAELPYALANTTLAGNELTGLIDSAEADPLPIAGEALGVLLGLIPSEERRVAMAKAEALRDYVRAIMDLRRTIDAIDRSHGARAGLPIAVPPELKARLSQALAALAEAEQAAVRAWAPEP